MNQGAMFNETLFNKSSNYTLDTPTDLPTWSVNLFVAINVVIMVLAVTGNSVILIVEQFNKQKSSTDWFVTLMSFNDLIVAACVIPVYILSYNGMWHRVGSDFLCGLSFYIQETLSYSSTLVLTVTALDRYIKTCRPHSTGITPKRAMCICAGVALFTSMLTVGIPFITRYDEEGKCIYHITSKIAKTAIRGLVTFITTSFLVMFIVVVFSYSMVGLAIRKRIKAPVASGRDHKNGLISSTTEENERRNGTKITFISKLLSRKNQVEPQPQTSDGVQGNNDHNEISIIPIEKERPKKPVKITNIAEHLRILKEKNMNRTSVIMLAVTLVFILSWIPPWAVSMLWSEGLGYDVNSRIIQMFGRRSFIINTCTNPLFYIGMSSEFRKLTRRTFIKIWNRLTD